MGKRPVPKPETLNEAYKEAVDRFQQRDDLTAIDVGRKWVAGVPSNEIAVRLHVWRKVPASELDAAAVFPDKIRGVPIDVIEGKYRIPAAAPIPTAMRRGRFPFLMGGVSCGRVDGSAGTVGTIVKDRKTGQTGILSTWHALAGPQARAGDAILQPGRIDGGRPQRDTVARLDRWMLDTGGDAAVAFLAPGRAWLPLHLGSSAEISGVRAARLGEVLTKSGRTTGVTSAIVDGIGLYRMTYEVAPGQFERRDIRGFKLVPLLEGNPYDEDLSSGGDCGAVWIDEGQNAVGLHFAGERAHHPAQEHAIACDMGTVLDRLDVEPAGFEDLGRVDISGTVPPRAAAEQPARTPRSPISDPRDCWDPLGDPEATGGLGTTYAATRVVGVAASLVPRDVDDIWLRLDAALDNAGFVEPRRAFTARIDTLICGGDAYAPLRTVINSMGVFPEIRAITTREIRQFATYDTLCDFLARLRQPGG